MNVHLQAVARLAAQQLPDRLPERLAKDVPQGDLDSADRGVQDRAAAPARPTVHRLPVHLDVAGVAADQVPLVLLYCRSDRGLLAGNGALAQTGDALIGIDLDEHIVGAVIAAAV